LGARLGQLLIELRGRDHRQHVPGAHAAADIDVALADIAGRAGKECGAIEGLNGSRQIDLQRSIIGAHHRDPHHRHGRPRRIESGNGCGGAIGMLQGTHADQQAQTRQSAQSEQPRRAATPSLGPRIEHGLLLQLGDEVFYQLRRNVVHGGVPKCVRGCGKSSRRRLDFPITE
jgi:hypothetical protein